VATHEFVGLAREAARSQGLADTRIVSVDHPIGGVDAGIVRQRAELATDLVLRLLTGI